MYFETSKDVLNMTLSICVLGFTVFLCWAMFYVVASVRNLFKLVKQVSDTVNKVENLVDSIKEKIHSSISYLPLIGEGVKKIVDIIKEHTSKKKESKEAESEKL